MRNRKLVLLAAVPFLVGCFPIELDVSKDGRILVPRKEGFFTLDPAQGKVAKVWAPPSGQPAFARFAPDGKSILAVTTDAGEMVFTVVEADGKARKLCNATNVTYTRFGPDGQTVAFCRVADEKKAPLDEQLPELRVAPAAGGEVKTLASNVSSLLRWLPDSKSLLVFQIAKKDDKGRYFGQLVKVDTATGTATPLAEAIGQKGVFFDLSPDGRKALLTAFAAGAPKAKLEVKEQPSEELFEVDVAAMTARAVGRKAGFAIYSPDGKRVLTGGNASDGKLTLEVSSADLKESVPVARDAADKAGGMGNDVDIYPGWVNNDTVFYLARKAVYGTAGLNYQLTSVGADGKNPKNLQPLLDTEAAK